jgi:hypothetical protein
MDTVTVERLDQLGIIAGVIKDLGIIEMIDARIVPDDQEDITTGEAVAGMILNGLGFSVAYLLAADNVSGLLPIPLRGQSAGEHHSKPVFKTPCTPLGLHLSTLRPSTIRSSSHADF